MWNVFPLFPSFRSKTGNKYWSVFTIFPGNYLMRDKCASFESRLHQLHLCPDRSMSIVNPPSLNTIQSILIWLMTIHQKMVWTIFTAGNSRHLIRVLSFINKEWRLHFWATFWKRFHHSLVPLYVILTIVSEPKIQNERPYFLAKNTGPSLRR